MQYDPIKRKLGLVFNTAPFLRKMFYRLLDILLLRSWHIRKELKLWEKKYRGKRAILDAGSGFGQYDYYMATRHTNWKITGVDVKDEQIADCNRFFKKIGLTNASFAKADLSTLAENETYDLVLCVDVMEHIEKDEKVLKNYYNALKTGGMLLISTPSDKGGSDVHHHHGSKSFIDEHVREGYGIQEIKSKMKMAGFSKTEVYYQYGKPGDVSWKLSMKFPIIMLNVSYLFFVILPFYYLITFPVALILNWFDLTGHHKTGTGIVAKAWKLPM